MLQSPWQPTLDVTMESSAHLGIPRKDLDVSNFTQDSEDMLLSLNKSELLKLISASPDLRHPHSVDAIIRLAHALEEERLPNRELLPDASAAARSPEDKPMRPLQPVRQDGAVVRGTNDAVNVELGDDVLKTLWNAVEQHRKHKKRKATSPNRLGLFEDFYS
jgi:hypothetical protein